MSPNREAMLWRVVRGGHSTRVRALLRALEPLERQKLVEQTLWFAVRQGDSSVVEALLEGGGNPEQTLGGVSLLMEAAWQGHAEVVRSLVRAGASIDRKYEGKTALEAALENDHRDVAEQLRKMGARWEFPTLMHACEQGDLSRAKEAIAAGASIHRIHGVSNETPLMRAAGKGRVEVVRYLLHQGADPRKGVKGRTSLWNAAATGRSVAVVDALVEAGGEVNDDYDGCTVLMAAAQSGCLAVVRRLVDLGADVKAIDRVHERGVLDYARAGKSAELTMFLGRAGASSVRDAASDLARAIAREFGGRPVCGSFGVVFKSRLSGFRCQFRVGHSGGSSEIVDLDFIDPAIRDAPNAELSIGHKPGPDRGSFRRVRRAEAVLGSPVYRSVGEGCLRAEAAIAFCSRHGKVLRRVSLSAAEQLRIGASWLQFRWLGSDYRRLRCRLVAFGAIARSVARQTAPAAGRDRWD